MLPGLAAVTQKKENATAAILLSIGQVTTSPRNVWSAFPAVRMTQCYTCHHLSTNPRKGEGWIPFAVGPVHRFWAPLRMGPQLWLRTETAYPRTPRQTQHLSFSSLQKVWLGLIW